MTAVWKHATVETPCPICSGTDRCVIADGAALCRRKRAGGRRVAPAAYLFDLAPRAPLWTAWRQNLDKALGVIEADRR